MSKRVLLYITFAFFIAFFIVLLTWYFLSSKNEKSILCHSQQEIRVQGEGREASMDSALTFIMYGDGTGEVDNIGRVRINGVDYEVKRTLHFTYTRKDYHRIFNIKIINENVGLTDNVPKELYYTIFLPGKPGQQVSLSIESLGDNLLLVSGLVNPYFVCRIG